MRLRMWSGGSASKLIKTGTENTFEASAFNASLSPTEAVDDTQPFAPSAYSYRPHSGRQGLENSLDTNLEH